MLTHQKTVSGFKTWVFTFLPQGSRKSKKNSFCAMSSPSLFVLPILNLGKLDSKANHINSDWFCKDNHVKHCARVVLHDVILQHLSRQMQQKLGLGSVRVCFKKSTSVGVHWHSQRLEVLVNEVVHKMCSTHYHIYFVVIGS